MTTYKITADMLDQLKIEPGKWYAWKMGYGCFIKDNGEIEELPKDMIKMELTDTETGAKLSTFTYNKEIEQ